MGHHLTPLSIHGRDDGGRRVISPSSQKNAVVQLAATSYAELVERLACICVGSGAWAECSRIGFSIASLASPGTAWWTGLLQRSS